MSNQPRRKPSGADPVGPFLHYLMAECGVSPHTLAAYRSDLMKFLRWRREVAPGPLETLDLATLAGYVDYLGLRELAPSSISRHLASLSTFFRFLVLDGRLDDNVARLILAPKLWERLPLVLSPAAVDRLLAAPDPTTSIGRRDRAVLELLYATGCRASEVAGLRPADVDQRGSTVRCVGKGDKERLVPIGERARQAVLEYERLDRPAFAAKGKGSDRLFLSRRGGPLSRVGVWNVVKQHARLCGLPERVSPHTLRHSVATHLLAGGADLRVVQEILGHASIGTTQIYTRVEMSRLLDVHRKFHPRGSSA
jgi:integrase/recombinase XerD